MYAIQVLCPVGEKVKKVHKPTVPMCMFYVQLSALIREVVFVLTCMLVCPLRFIFSLPLW